MWGHRFTAPGMRAQTSCRGHSTFRDRHSRSLGVVSEGFPESVMGRSLVKKLGKDLQMGVGSVRHVRRVRSGMKSVLTGKAWVARADPRDSRGDLVVLE